MSPGQCSCPDCGTTLRVRDRSFVGRQIECPDCHVKLVIKLDDERNLVAEQPKAEPTQASARRLAVPAAKVGSVLGAKLHGILYSPLTLAWALAIGITAFAAILMLRPSVRFQTPPKDNSRPIADVAPTDGPASKGNNPKTQPVEAAPEKNSPTQVVVDPPAVPNDSIVEGTGTPGPELPPADVPSVEKPIDTVGPPAAKPAAIPQPVVPVPVKIDVEERLKQRLGGYVTGRPVSRQRLIEELEEMLGTPIRYDREELGEKNLERSVSINLNSTTVGGILKALLDSAGWDFVIEENGIRLTARQVAGSVSP